MVKRNPTILSISSSVSILWRPNGGITDLGFDRVASQICARNFAFSGKRCFIAANGWAMLPPAVRLSGHGSTAIVWQARQSPLLRLIDVHHPFVILSGLSIATHCLSVGKPSAATAGLLGNWHAKNAIITAVPTRLIVLSILFFIYALAATPV